MTYKLKKYKELFECHFPELFEMKKEEFSSNLETLINHYDDEERAKEEFDWFWDTLTELNSGGYIYRVVFLPDLKYLDRDDLGSCWTVDKENARSLVNNLHDMLELGEYDHGKEYDKEDYEPYLIEAKTETNNINFNDSMSQFCELPHEQEINLIDNKKVEIKSIEKI